MMVNPLHVFSLYNQLHYPFHLLYVQLFSVNFQDFKCKFHECYVNFKFTLNPDYLHRTFVYTLIKYIGEGLAARLAGRLAGRSGEPQRNLSLPNID